MALKKTSLIVGLIALTIFMLRAYLLPMLWAGIFAVIVYPLMQYVPIKKHSLRALILTIFTFLVILLPILILMGIAGHEIQTYLNQHDVSKQFNTFITRLLSYIPHGSELAQQVKNINWQKEILERVNWVSTKMSLNVFTYVGGVISGTLFSILFFLLFLFAFLSHGVAIRDFILNCVLEEFSKPEQVIEQIVITIRGTSSGLLLTALVVLLVMTPIYIVTGLPIPYFFGLLTAFAAMVPFVLPICYSLLGIFMYFNVGLWQALLLFGVGIGLNLLTDNILQPSIIQKNVKVYFLVSLLGVLAGLQVFGIVGVFLGPIVLNTCYNFLLQANK